MSQPSPASNDERYDLAVIARRILKIAEIATLEHLESILASQAQGILELTAEPETH